MSGKNFTTVIVDDPVVSHNAKCDVEWTDGTPNWKRAIERNGMARICGNCFERLEPRRSIMIFPKDHPDDAKPDGR